jgi:hypothetical protein
MIFKGMQDWLKQVTLQGPSINACTLGYIFTGESSYRIGSQRLTVQPILFVENLRKYRI